MHKYLRAIGFSEIKKKDLEFILEDVIEHPQVMKVTKDSEGNEFAELKREFAQNIGLAVCGTYDSEDNFRMEYYYPYLIGSEVSTYEEVDIEKHAEKESYAGVCDEMRIGVTLIFYLQNVADFLSEHHQDMHHGSHIYVKGLPGAMLSGLSTEGKILLPIEQKKPRENVTNGKSEKRQQLLAEARDGNEAAIESLTMEDMDTYSSLTRRITKEDVFSIVSTCFMPYGIESDHYSILGEIVELSAVTNSYSGETMYLMKINCNDIFFDVVINQEDLLGEPAVGRRFKGSIWLQGSVNLY